jgi:gamma-glutamylaminecyclotransferase
MHAVFVYGSLKKGFYNHAHLRGAHFVGPAVTCDAYTLFSLGKYPGLTKLPAQLCVAGELYQLTDSGLARLDQLEENGHEYLREIIQVQDNLGQVLSAWCYFYLRPRPRTLCDSGTHIIRDGCISWCRRR